MAPFLLFSVLSSLNCNPQTHQYMKECIEGDSVAYKVRDDYFYDFYLAEDAKEKQMESSITTGKVIYSLDNNRCLLQLSPESATKHGYEAVIVYSEMIWKDDLADGDLRNNQEKNQKFTKEAAILLAKEHNLFGIIPRPWMRQRQNEQIVSNIKGTNVMKNKQYSSTLRRKKN